MDQIDQALLIICNITILICLLLWKTYCNCSKKYNYFKCLNLLFGKYKTGVCRTSAIVFTKLTHLIEQAKQAIIQTHKVSGEVHQHPLERLLDALHVFPFTHSEPTDTFTQGS